MRKSLGFTLLLALILFSCNKPPEACIQVDQDVVAVGTPVTLTSCSERALSYIWSMQGPVGAPENNIQWSEEVVTRSFSVPGTYTVTLEAYKKYSWIGDMASATTTITVQ